MFPPSSSTQLNLNPNPDPTAITLPNPPSSAVCHTSGQFDVDAEADDRGKGCMLGNAGPEVM